MGIVVSVEVDGVRSVTCVPDILVPTDGSDAVEAAVEQGVELARRFEAILHTVYVVEPTYTTDVGIDEILTALEEHGEEATAAVVDPADAVGIDAVSEVRTGTPHREILGYVEENDIDLIVMGTHGRTGLERYLLGSVTEKIVRLSDVPVLTVRTESLSD